LKYHPTQGFEAGKRLNFMQWIAPSEKDTGTDTLEKRLWDAADQLRANPGVKPQQYSGPIRDPSFLRFAAQRAGLAKAGASVRRASRIDDPAAYHAEDILHLRAETRFDYLANRHGGNVNSYCDDPHDATGRSDFVFSPSELTQ
jgi:hypothetical protein